MRLFLALDLPKETKRKLSNEIESLQEEYPYFRWVGEENFHITLHYLGAGYKIPYVKNKVNEAIYDASPFYLYSSGVDLFIRERITLYIEFLRSKPLEHLVSSIRDNLGVGERKKFVPHLTIARYKIPSKQQYLHLKKKLKNLEIDIQFKITKLYLFDSILETSKPLYKRVAEFELG